MKYVAEEGLQQFRDYYETDDEERPYFDYYNQVNEREKLRFAEHYENFYSKALEMDKYYVSIPKRPYDNSKSIFVNFVQDLVDFNRRVRPIQRTLAFQDATAQYQTLPLQLLRFEHPRICMLRLKIQNLHLPAFQCTLCGHF
jgi:hypothetical protein